MEGIDDNLENDKIILVKVENFQQRVFVPSRQHPHLLFSARTRVLMTILELDIFHVLSILKVRVLHQTIVFVDTVESFQMGSQRCLTEQR